MWIYYKLFTYFHIEGHIYYFIWFCSTFFYNAHCFIHTVSMCLSLRLLESWNCDVKWNACFKFQISCRLALQAIPLRVNASGYFAYCQNTMSFNFMSGELYFLVHWILIVLIANEFKYLLHYLWKFLFGTGVHQLSIATVVSHGQQLSNSVASKSDHLFCLQLWVGLWFFWSGFTHAPAVPCLWRAGWLSNLDSALLTMSHAPKDSSRHSSWRKQTSKTENGSL